MTTKAAKPELKEHAERIKMLIKKLNIEQKDLAKSAGVREPTVTSYVKQESQPSMSTLSKWIRDFKINGHWLLTGEGEMFSSDIPSKLNEKTATARSVRDLLHKLDPDTLNPGDNLPLVGLAACGISGWSQTMPLAINSSIPNFHKDYISAMTIGDSMVPAGILPGNIVYCDPRIKPMKGEPVFVVRRDADSEGTASVKNYCGQDDKWLYLQGWLQKNGNAEQKSFDIKQLISEVETIAPVVMVRRRV